MKPKMLVVSAHPPLKDSKEAGQKVFFNFMKFISEFVDIHLISIVNSEEHNWGLKESLSELQCSELKLIEVSALQKLVNCFRYPFRAIHYNTKASSKIVIEMAALLEQHNYKYIHFEWEQMIQYVTKVDKTLLSNSNVSVTCHDVMHQMYERKAKTGKLGLLYKLQTKLCIKNEKNWFSKIDHILTLNDKDRRLVESLKLDSNVRVVRPFYHKTPDVNIGRKQYDLVFFGALNRNENNDAVIWFINKIFPYIMKVNPKTNMVIVGNGPSKELLQISRSYPNIKVTGFVENPYQIIADSRIGIIPLRLGAGIKIKLLESMACGVPVVSTSVGAEGTDFTEEDGLFLAEEECLFAEKVLHLLSNPDYSLQMGERARLSIEDVYSREEYVKSISEAFNVAIEKDFIKEENMVPAL
ncbi:glycosyltransferase [Paenibacillus sp. GCM10012307]|uniref:Glycosyltransferase n=1 Tax=Paenibacillus roseus TaxID=2798579 RepID=A0A934MNW7_9BACL|nr:glycosyltransferase family 4 protein [Paenibacillus roseus]MBJ6360263.1 glycosyltransferase [Paenibacillus roseus]